MIRFRQRVRPPQHVTTFKRSGADPVSPVLSDTTSGTTTAYLPGISSRVSSTSTFNHSGIKNATLQTNSSQTNTATKRYDAFGNELATTGTWQTRFDYSGAFGYQRDDDTGYKLLGHRYYDPSTGGIRAASYSRDTSGHITIARQGGAKRDNQVKERTGLGKDGKGAL